MCVCVCGGGDGETLLYTDATIKASFSLCSWWPSQRGINKTLVLSDWGLCTPPPWSHRDLSILQQLSRGSPPRTLCGPWPLQVYPITQSRAHLIGASVKGIKKTKSMLLMSVIFWNGGGWWGGRDEDGEGRGWKNKDSSVDNSHLRGRYSSAVWRREREAVLNFAQGSPITSCLPVVWH